MNIKLLKAKSYWVKLMCEHYFEEKNKMFLPKKNEREEVFLHNIQQGLKLNEKDFIEYLISEGWTPSMTECYATYFKEGQIQEGNRMKKYKYAWEQSDTYVYEFKAKNKEEAQKIIGDNFDYSKGKLIKDKGNFNDLGIKEVK